VAVLLEAVAKALDAGADIVAEPELRDATGTIARSGLLNLPRRADIAVTREGRTRTIRIESRPLARGKPAVVATKDGFVIEIAPFRWDAAAMTVFAHGTEPDWAPLRRWFLEWFQSRHGDTAPELFGAVHSLDGPAQRGRDWGFTVDFGSAPVACLTDLIGALAEAGAERMRLGQA
jgi:hypothetical protein